MDKHPAEFPKYVCWQPSTRPTVFNTVALRVPDAVFNATHTAIPLLRRDPRSNDTLGVLSEQQFLEDLIAPNKQHSFCVVGGEPGTGKSHLVKWMYRQLQTQSRSRTSDMHVVLVPRDSANLADVLGRIMEGFSGENIDRIREEIQRSSNLTETGYMTHVLDQLAFSVDPRNLESTHLSFPHDDTHEIILSCLPPMLRDQAIREHLMADTGGGIVSRLARHVFGERRERPDLKGKCEWKAADLHLEPKVTKQAGAAARQMATSLYADEALQAAAAKVLNNALNEALPRLVGLRMGSLKGAFFEIRAELKKRKKKLVLLIEDLSIAQGMDAELIEALQVTPADGGDELCELRSVVGVTPEDLRRLYTNIRERIDLAVELEMRLEDDNLGPEFLLRFATKYLNASKYPTQELEKWNASRSQDAELPSFCRAAKCPNLRDCHAAFGAVDDCGLYPFNGKALATLYASYQKGAMRDSAASSAFNPRALVGPIMGQFLAKAEESIGTGDFPSESLLREFHLLPGIGSRKLMPAQVQDELDQKYGEQGSRRIQGLIELYSSNPSKGKANPRIAQAFDVQLQAREQASPDEEKSTTATQKPEQTTASVGPDVFDNWATKQTLPQSVLSRWRQDLYQALRGFHDWDADSEGWAFYENTVFAANHIEFEGQPTQTRNKGAKLVVKATSRHARAMRVIISASGDASSADLICACELLEKLTSELKHQLGKLTRASASNCPLEKALELMLLDAAIHGDLEDDLSDVKLLSSMFESRLDPLPPHTADQIKDLPVVRSWAQARRAFDSREMAQLRDWFRKRVVASKGGSTRAGVLRTAVLLKPLKKARSSLGTSFADIDQTTWNQDIYRPVSLAITGPVAKLRDGLEQQTKALATWSERVQRLVGSQISPVRLKAICASIHAGIDSDVITDPTARDLVNLIDKSAEEFSESARSVQNVVKSKNPLKQLAALGRVDFVVTTAVLEALGKLEHLLESAEKSTSRALADAESQDTDALICELNKELSRLQDALDELNAQD